MTTDQPARPHQPTPLPRSRFLATGGLQVQLSEHAGHLWVLSIYTREMSFTTHLDEGALAELVRFLPDYGDLRPY
jgi:hypothetical protein